MPVRDFGALTWEEVAALDHARAVAILPVGAIEAHGPHLPLATDVIIAEAMARAGAEGLSATGLEVLLLPALAYAPAPFAADFPGTVTINGAEVTNAVTAIAASLARHGIKILALANAHFDPAHVSALRAVRGVVFPDLTRRALAQRLTPEFQSGACHAGSYETSIVMATQPNLVKESVRTGLPANHHSLSAALPQGKTTFRDAGGPRAYFGAPAEATAAEGRATIALLGKILAESVLEAMAA